MEDLNSEQKFKERLIGVLQADAVLSDSDLPSRLIGVIDAGVIDFTASGEIRLEFDVSRQRVSTAADIGRETAELRLENIKISRSEKNWTDAWFGRDPELHKDVFSSASLIYSEICGNCSGERDVECRKCTGKGKVTCPERECRGGNIPCSRCKGNGTPVCDRCHGACRTSELVPERQHNGAIVPIRRDVRCGQCAGTGRSGICSCYGSGSERCGVCSGRSVITCRECRGKGRNDCLDCGMTGRVSNRMTIEPRVRQDLEYTPDERPELFAWLRKNAPEYLSQASTRSISITKCEREGARAMISYRSSAAHAIANDPDATEGVNRVRVVIGHENAPQGMTVAYVEALAEPTARRLREADFAGLRGYDIGRDALARLTDKGNAGSDLISRYGLNDKLGQVISEAKSGIGRHAQAGEWPLWAAFLLTGGGLGLVRNSPEALRVIGQTIPDTGVIYAGLFYAPWILMAFCFWSIRARRKRRARLMMGDGKAAAPRSRLFLPAAAALFAVQAMTMAGTAVLPTPLTRPANDGQCGSPNGRFMAQCLIKSVVAPAIIVFLPKARHIDDEIADRWQS